MPVISFVIPTRDVAPYIETCLRSILGSGEILTGDASGDASDDAAGDGAADTYGHRAGNELRDIEVIVVEDASSDATPAIVERLAARDQRITVLRHETAAGAGASRNEGVAAAVGDFVWFVDSDDWLFDGAVDRVLARLSADDPAADDRAADDRADRTELDVLFVNYVRAFEGGRTAAGDSTAVLARAPHDPFTLRSWPDIVGVLHVPWNKIVRRRLLVDGGVTFPVGSIADVADTYRLLPLAAAIGVEPVVAYAWRTGRPGQITRTPGAHQLIWAEQWRQAFEACRDEPVAVRAAIFRRMIWHGWVLLVDPQRVSGPLRREFFVRFVDLYREQRGPGMPRNPVLGSRSFALARLRLLPRRLRDRVLVPGRIARVRRAAHLPSPGRRT